MLVKAETNISSFIALFLTFTCIEDFVRQETRETNVFLWAGPASILIAVARFSLLYWYHSQ